MFFVRGLGATEASPTDTVLTAHLTFRGEPSGSLTLRISAPAARGIASDFLGVDEEDLSDREVGDVICELANMICGSLLSRVGGEATFRLASPRLLGDAEVSNSGMVGAEQKVALAQGVMFVSIDI